MFSLFHNNKFSDFSNDTCCLNFGGNYNLRDLNNLTKIGIIVLYEVAYS